MYEYFKITLLCIAYLVMITPTSVLPKVSDKLYDYSPLSITIFYLNISFLVNVLIYHVLYRLNTLWCIEKEIMKKLCGISVIYCVETVLLYWALKYVPLGFYIIGRTSVVFTDIVFYKYIYISDISIYIYIGSFLFLCSYVLNIYGYNDETKYNLKTIVSIILVFASGISSSIISNITRKCKSTLITDKKQFRYLINVYINVCGFIFFPIPLILSILNNDYTKKYEPNILYILTGIFFQLHIIPKVYILTSDKYNGNKIITFIDIIRRILSIIVGITLLDDPSNLFIILSIVVMVLGCIFLFIDVNKKKLNEINNMTDINIIKSTIV